ncbi:hypothetical protein D9758_002851 [Tetrapyrgos nigripes]|uniref:Cytochrome P450 n=1 Tax=Tetrapyrgos nigripes TaxID=182062 RepID=A0A8H5GPI9_9AGAR|nr:hypothetical protein D9758_002851 [Tetrapyrgos nigripes]
MEIRTSLKILGLFVLPVAFYLLRTNRPGVHLPPGPRRIPVFGNIFQVLSQVDFSQSWLAFGKWKEIYGPLVYINIVGQRVVILNSRKVVEDLLDHRASKYSDRAQNLLVQYLSRQLNMVVMHYSDPWRKMRRASEAALGPRMMTNYHRKQTEESVLLAYGVLNQPISWDFQANRAASSSILSTVYDLPSIQSPDHPSIAFMDEFINRNTQAVLPGSYLVNVFPVLDYLPDCMSEWRIRARNDFDRYTRTFQDMFQRIKNRYLSGMEQRPSFCLTLVENTARHGMSDEENAWLAGTLYAAGQETSTSVLHWFFLSMILFPEVQQRAQEELDRVVGRSRLPSFADLKHLPYIVAIINELQRWRPVIPLGVPHALIEDDYYEGYLIPKGTIAVANVWSLNHDPEIYGPDADQFRPERHLDENGFLKDPKDDGHFTFGFGQRVCVGRYVANNFLFITCAMVLWAMRIEPVKDAQGNGILPDPDDFHNLNGIILRPSHFDFAASVRFEDADSLIQQARDEILRESASHEDA